MIEFLETCMFQGRFRSTREMTIPQEHITSRKTMIEFLETHMFQGRIRSMREMTIPQEHMLVSKKNFLHVR
jgi:hypothetical protein